MVAIEFAEPEPIIECERTGVGGFDFEAGARCPAFRGPSSQARNDAAGITAAQPLRVGDDRLVADQTAMDRTERQCADATIIDEHGKCCGDR